MATLSATRILPALWMLAVLPSAAEPGTAERLQVLAQEVTAAERDFARSMAERNVQAFSGFIAEDAVFRDGHDLLLGRSAVVEGWRNQFKPGPAPFSWEPDRVTVAASGATAVSSRPVRDSDGKIVGRFTTIWHRETGTEGGAHWRVIVDQGVPLIESGGPSR